MRFDVIVIGAGTAGAVTARQLHRAGLHALLIGRASTGFKPGESLPGAAGPLLRDLNLLDTLQRSAPLANLGNLISWQSAALTPTDFIHDPHGPGWHLDRAHFDGCLLDTAREDGVPLVKAQVNRVSRTEQGWCVGSEVGDFSSGFLIDASGRHGVLRRRLGLARICDPRLVAVYATGRDLLDDRRTLLEATQEGWWYSAPLPGRRRIAVLHTDAHHASRLMRASQLWQQGLTDSRHLRHLSTGAEGWSAPCVTGAGGGALRTAQGPGWLAVGDAAMTFDPLSSQGIFNALYTALRGAQAAVAQHHGNAQAGLTYAEQLQKVREHYLSRVQWYYRAQTRWPQARFWQGQRSEF